MASFRLEMKMLPVQAAYTKELLLLLRCQPSRNLLNGVTLPLLCMQFDTVTGPFYFWYPEMAEQSDGRKQKTDAFMPRAHPHQGPKKQFRIASICWLK